MLSRFSRGSSRADNNNEKLGYAYEQDSARLQRATPISRTAASSNRYIGSFAPNPSFIRFVRFFLYSLTSMSALAMAGVGLGVAHYYNTHRPVVYPSWGSLIACIVFGIGTPGVLFGLFLVTPHLFRHGGVGALLNQTRIELVMLFNLSVFWVSGALALACDLRGRENCIWDGYYHYPKPADFDKVCNLINVSVALAYTTFGLCVIQMVVVYTAAIYILLFLDQEVLTEPTNDMGGRAYRARTLALAQHQTLLNAERAQVSTAGPLPMAERNLGAGPMAGGASSRSLPRNVEENGLAGGRRYQDEEETEDGEDEETEEEHEQGDESAGGYYGFDGPAGRLGHGRV